MTDTNIEAISYTAGRTGLKYEQVRNTIEMLDEGLTIPFITRYRKERTGGLNEVEIGKIDEIYSLWKKISKRKEEILASLEKQNLLSSDLKDKLLEAVDMETLEDLYLPYKKKRKTRADKAKEAGALPLAEFILRTRNKNDQYIDDFVRTNKNFNSRKEAMAAAGDIISENISATSEVRKMVRELFLEKGYIKSVLNKKADTEKVAKYRDYYEFSQKVKFIPDFRVLAINRGEQEECLKVSIEIPFHPIKNIAILMHIARFHPYREFLDEVITDSLKRLIYPSLEREVRKKLTENAHKRSAEIFSENVKYLLLAKPRKNVRVLGIDPGFRTGCKAAYIDEKGHLLHFETIFPFDMRRLAETAKHVSENIKKMGVKVIAIGNGTASHETVEFIRKYIIVGDSDVEYVIIPETGASVYSASECAREEFPELDAVVRGAVTIARRIQSPIDEYVKVPPEALGVGMYQHDVPESLLNEKIVSSISNVVNAVGVDINYASKYLLQYVSGFNRSVAENIVEYREANGNFKNRKQLMKVKGLGTAKFNNAAGFCIVSDSTEYLDKTIIHPEDYTLIKKLSSKLKVKDVEKISENLDQTDMNELSLQTGISIQKLEFIRKALKSNTDDAILLDSVLYNTGSITENDLYEGMQIKGQVKNVVDFGVFVDLGIKTDGLIHKSEFSSPKEMYDKCYIGQVLDVVVNSIDLQRKRIQLGIDTGTLARKVTSLFTD